LAEAEEDACGEGQVLEHFLEHIEEAGEDEREEERDREGAEREDEHGVSDGGGDFAADFVLVFEEGGEVIHGAGEGAGFFPYADHADVERGEEAGMFFQCAGERGAFADGVGKVEDRLAEGGVSFFLAETFERLGDGDGGIEEGGDFAGESGDIAASDFAWAALGDGGGVESCGW
jgi:hypothetical protein